MQEREQQQHQGYVAYADATALQLAAVIPLDRSAAKQQDIQDSLGQFAWLPHGGLSEALPGPLLGVLAAPPSVSQQLHAGTAVHLGDSPAAVQDAAAGAAVQDSNELKSLKSILAALHGRWQHGGFGWCTLPYAMQYAPACKLHVLHEWFACSKVPARSLSLGAPDPCYSNWLVVVPVALWCVQVRVSCVYCSSAL
jgi:hypothetical protein